MVLVTVTVLVVWTVDWLMVRGIGIFLLYYFCYLLYSSLCRILQISINYLIGSSSVQLPESGHCSVCRKPVLFFRTMKHAAIRVQIDM